MSDAPAIEFEGLSKSYGDKRALVDATLTVGRGEVFGYAGPNGAGKSTTIKILAGLLKPTAGVARVLGHDIVKEPLAAKARIGYVPESGAVFDRFSAREYLSLLAELHEIDRDVAASRIDSWLQRFRLEAESGLAMTGLSKGNRQKVCWIAALLHEPEVLILDEPLNGLDVETVALVKGLMASMAAEGKTIFYSSHLIDIVTRVCTRVAVIHGGRILAAGTVGDVSEQLGGGSLEDVLLSLSSRPAAS